jgi:hypothetical protein
VSGFPIDYRQARDRFRRAAQERGAALDSYLHPTCAGPDGAPLRTDVAWLGPPNAANVLVCVSGTHGVEGRCGSACQVDILINPPNTDPPPATATLFIHALNPYGMAHDRRVNEDNIDINRNWIDHNNPPENPDYELVHEALVPRSWTGPEREAADRALSQIITDRGIGFVQTSVTRGQWSHPDGLFYGGREYTWSTRVLRTICADYLAGLRHIGYIDLHTGLGVYGEAEPIFRGGRDDRALSRARSWYVSVTQSEESTSSSTPIVGNTATLVADALSENQLLTAITLEFGTLPGRTVLNALRADNWLRLQAKPDPRLTKEITTQIREAFCPTDKTWQATVLAKSRAAYHQALNGLGTVRKLS